MNLCLLASWVKIYHLDDGKIWKQIVDAKYRTRTLIFLHVLLFAFLPFGKVFCGLVMPLNLAIPGRLAMARGSGSRKTSGPGPLPWPHSSGIFILLLMNIMCQLAKCGMVFILKLTLGNAFLMICYIPGMIV